MVALDCIQINTSLDLDKLQIEYKFKDDSTLLSYSDRNKYGFLNIINNTTLREVVIKIQDSRSIEWISPKWFRNLQNLKKIRIYSRSHGKDSGYIPRRPLLVGCPKVNILYVHEMKITDFYSKRVEFPTDKCYARLDKLQTHVYYKILKWYRTSLNKIRKQKIDVLSTVCNLNHDLLHYIVSFIIQEM
jgi:hypothetical protein